jgi:hypothetical protein
MGNKKSKIIDIVCFTKNDFTKEKIHKIANECFYETMASVAAEALIDGKPFSFNTTDKSIHYRVDFENEEFFTGFEADEVGYIFVFLNSKYFKKTSFKNIEDVRNLKPNSKDCFKFKITTEKETENPKEVLGCEGEILYLNKNN